jgi:hypothetical protein
VPLLPGSSRDGWKPLRLRGNLSSRQRAQIVSERRAFRGCLIFVQSLTGGLPCIWSRRADGFLALVEPEDGR